MKLLFHPDAEAEFLAAVRHYMEIDPELGLDFEAKVEECASMAMMYPSMWRMLTKDIHRALVRRFPYGIIYAYDEDVMYVLAVMHLHAKPGYWKSRIKDSPTSPRRRRPRRI